jgi:hypothetical protein
MKNFIIPVALTYFTLLQSCKTEMVPYNSSILKRDANESSVSLGFYKSPEDRNKIQDKNLSLAMSISGGGSRSSNFGKGVLLELEKIQYVNQKSNPGDTSTVLNEIDYFSTVSGGGHAAGAYFAFLNQKETGSKTFNDFYLDKNGLPFKFYVKLLGTNLIPALFQRFPVNRNKQLEKEVDRHVLLCKNKKSKPILLGDIFIDSKNTEKQVKYPLLVANGTNLDNILILQFHPKFLDSLHIQAYFDWHNRSRCLKEQPDMYKLPLAVALTASGSVPLLVPPLLFKIRNSKSQYLRVVDGGLSENKGFKTAKQLLDQAPKENRKVVLIVEDTPGGVGDRYYHQWRGKNHYSITKTIWYGLDAKYTSFYGDIDDAMKKMDCNDKPCDSKAGFVILDFRTLLENPGTLVPHWNRDDSACHINPDYFNKIKNSSQLKTLDANLHKKYTANPSQFYDENIEWSPKRKVHMVKDLYDRYYTSGIPNILERIYLFEIVTHMETKYQAKEFEKEALILAGRIVVRIKSEQIKKNLGMNFKRNSE